MSILVAKKYIKNFENLGFGMFIHFGLYSLIGQGEWVGKLCADDPKLPVGEAEYKKLMNAFNPGSMEEIVAFAKRSGAKYITITTRHHDGFSLYDTCGLSEYDAPHALCGRDLIKEFVDACHKYGIVPFFYHTTLEFWNPDFEDNFEKYLEYLRESIRMLCTNYGKIGGFWFDGNWSVQGEGDVWQEDKLYGLIRELQPEAMIINNTGLSENGKLGHPEIDSVTFERGRVAPLNREGMEKYVASEVCDSVTMHWGLAKDFNYKSSKELIERLCDCRRVGANFLLNFGPNADGTVPDYPKAIFGTIGKWIDIFGEAIYEAEPYWWGEGKNFVLKKGDKAYIFCYDLCRKGSANVVYAGGREGEYTFKNFPVALKNVKWMDNGEELECSYENGNLKINITGYPYGVDYCVRVACADFE